MKFGNICSPFWKDSAMNFAFNLFYIFIVFFLPPQKKRKNPLAQGTYDGGHYRVIEPFVAQV